MIPETYAQWHRCITVDCGLALTPAFIAQRLAAMADPQSEETLRFRRLYGCLLYTSQPAEMERMIKQAREQLAAQDKWIKDRRAHIADSLASLDKAFDALVADRRQDELAAYPEAFKNSWLHAELNKARNFKQWFKKGRTVATLMTGIEQLVFKGKMPWTLRHSKPDHACLQPASQCARIDYPKPDGKLTFDKLSSVFISNTCLLYTSVRSEVPRSPCSMWLK